MPTSTRACSAYSFQTHLEVLRILSALVWFQLGMSKSLHQVILADVPWLSATGNHIHDLNIL